MSASGRCTYLLLLTAVVAMGILPRSWFGYLWYSSPVYPAFFGICWVPLVAWAILADVGAATRIAVLICALEGELHSRDLAERLDIPAIAVLSLGTVRLLGVRLKRASPLVASNTWRGQFSIADLLMVVAGIAAAVKASDAIWYFGWRLGSFFLDNRAYYRGHVFNAAWPFGDGLEYRLMTAIWFACLLALFLAKGHWRLAAFIPGVGILTFLFFREKAVVGGGYFKIVSWEHPAFMALDFLITQVLYVGVSLWIIRACGYRLCWVQPFRQRPLN